MTAFVVSDKIYQALFDMGAVQDDPEHVSRVIIDLKAGEAAKIYVELFAQREHLDVLLNGGIQLVT